MSKSVAPKVVVFKVNKFVTLSNIIIKLGFRLLFLENFFKLLTSILPILLSNLN